MTSNTPPPAEQCDLMAIHRPVAALTFGRPVRPAPVGPPPRVAHLPIDSLVIDDSYQRSLSAAGLRLIRRIAEGWDWNSYKPLSVAACGDGLYEVIDGQHTALGAATNGAIETLPCLILPADTRQQKAAAFVGINRDRINLTPFVLFRARLASGDRDAVAVQSALDDAGVTLHPQIRYDRDIPIGDVACVSALLSIVRSARGADTLTRALRIGRMAQFAPMTALALRAASTMIDNGGDDAEIAEALLAIGPDDLADHARENVRLGRSVDVVSAAISIIGNARESVAA